MSEPETITFREVGSNPLEDQANVSVRLDMSKNRLLPRLGKIFWPGREGDKPVASPPAPPIDPVVELEQKRELLAHLQSQFAIVKSRTEGKPPTSSTPIQAVATVTRQYVARLTDLESIAEEPWTDLALLADLLQRPGGEDLIGQSRLRILHLEAQLRPPATPSDEHQKLIAAAERDFRKFGKSHNALRRFELQNATAWLRHEFRAPRATYGINFGNVDAGTIKRVADLGESLPDGK